MIFFLGLHNPKWLTRTDAPSCVSYGVLRKRRRLPEPLGSVFLDSRGFTEVSTHGRYTFSAQEYADFAWRCKKEWGEKLIGASIMDFMCEPFVLAKTGLTVAAHQYLTVGSWVELNALNGEVPWVPVLQGFSLSEYHDCADLYEQHTATDLKRLPMVGLGSVCRRQGTAEAAQIVKSLWARGLHNLHAFGMKTTGLVSKSLRLAGYLKSSDSMAWSQIGRRRWRKGPGVKMCKGQCHKGSCANCLEWALMWRERLVGRIERVLRQGTQRVMF